MIHTTRVSSVPFFKLKIPRGQVLQNKKKFLTSYLNFKIILDFLNLRFLSIKTLQDTFFQFFFYLIKLVYNIMKRKCLIKKRNFDNKIQLFVVFF